MKLIIGLGNPGLKYEKTRHNAGFTILDKIKKYFTDNGLDFSKFTSDKGSNSEISKGVVGSEKIILLKPQTYMNKSGESVKMIVDFYKLNPENDLIVIYDDIDIKFSEINTKGTSSAGHNGMQSIINSLNTDKIKRIRVGILGKPKENIHSISDYVLSDFEHLEFNKIDNISQEVFSIINNDFLKL
jgi:peptidyl-tRNA hydrolase, PTH1 family